MNLDSHQRSNDIQGIFVSSQECFIRLGWGSKEGRWIALSHIILALYQQLVTISERNMTLKNIIAIEYDKEKDNS